MTDEKYIKEEIGKFDADLISRFIAIFLPAPSSSKRYKYIKVKSSDKIRLQVWGTSLESIWKEWQRFIKLRIFI
jgi:hypothetical protein